MCVISSYVNYNVRNSGKPPRPDPTLRALVGARLLRDRAYGIDTATKAMIVMGVSRPQIDAAVIVLKASDTGDERLLINVLAGRETLVHAAARLRNRVRLIASFKAASPADRAALGRTVGPDTVFDSTVIPAI